MDEKIPKIMVEVKSASTLKEGLKDINGKELPKKGIVIKKVTHCSEPITEYIVPESGNYYNYLTDKINKVDMVDFVSKAQKKLNE